MEGEEVLTVKSSINAIFFKIKFFKINVIRAADSTNLAGKPKCGFSFWLITYDLKTKTLAFNFWPLK